MKTRVCSSCQKRLTICANNFYRSKNRLDGFETQCKNCRKVAKSFKIKKSKKHYRESSFAKINFTNTL